MKSEEARVILFFNVYCPRLWRWLRHANWRRALSLTSAGPGKRQLSWPFDGSIRYFCPGSQCVIAQLVRELDIWKRSSTSSFE